MGNISKSQHLNTKLLMFLSLLSVTFVWASPLVCGEGEEAADKNASTPGLALHYSFDEGKGNTVNDLSGNGNSHYLLYANATTKSIVADIDLQNLMGKGAGKITSLFESTNVKTSLPKDQGSSSAQGRLSLSLQPLQCGVFRLR